MRVKDTELKRMRDRALYDVYLQGLREGVFDSLQQASEWICRHPAPQYYIEAKQVSTYFGMIESYVSLIGLNTCSRRRIRHLYNKYKEWREMNPGSTLTRERVCEILVDQEAPEFYIEPESARRIVQRIRREMQDEQIDKYMR